MEQPPLNLTPEELQEPRLDDIQEERSSQIAPGEIPDVENVQVKFIYSEKATKFCEIFTLLLTECTVVKSKVKISQNFVAFSEYVNFIETI